MTGQRSTSGLRTPAEEESAAAPVYVYGVVMAAAAAGGPLPRGVAGGESPVRLAARDDLAVVLGDVPPGWRAATRADVEGHEAVLSALVGRHTVVPMRFGMVMPSEAHAVDALLVRHGDELRTLLARLDGHVQVSVKAYYAEDGLLRQVLAEHPDIKRRSDALRGTPVEVSQGARIALGQDVAVLVERQRRRDEQTLAEPLAAPAADIRLEACTSPRMALNAQVLVARDLRSELDAAVDGLGAAHGDRFAFRYVGPVAPYSFADLSLDPEAPWA